MRTPEQRLESWQANKAAVEDHAARVAANRAALDALAIEARNFARASGALTVAQLAAATRKLAEMQARLYFDITYNDQ